MHICYSRPYLNDDNDNFDPNTYQTQNRFGSVAADNTGLYSGHTNGMSESELNEQIQNRIKDIKSRIELKKMFAEYEAGSLKPPHYYRDGIVGDIGNAEGDVEAMAAAAADDYDGDDDYSEALLHAGLKRTHTLDDPIGQGDSGQVQPKTTVFREKAREDPGVYIHSKQNHAGFVSDSNSDLASEGGVYTEGGLVFVPGSDSECAMFHCSRICSILLIVYLQYSCAFSGTKTGRTQTIGEYDQFLAAWTFGCEKTRTRTSATWKIGR